MVGGRLSVCYLNMNVHILTVSPQTVCLAEIASGSVVLTEQVGKKEPKLTLEIVL